MKWLALTTSAAAAAVVSAAVALVCALGMLHVAGAPVFAVVSNSMAPTMQRGDLVVVEPHAAAQIGDVVTFRKYGQVVTHRISDAAKQRDAFETRGDANPGNDPWTVSRSEMVGTVQSVVHRAGWPLLWLGNPRQRIAVYVLLLLTLWSLWWSLHRTLEVPVPER